MNDEIYQCDWNEFPHKIQRMFPIILMLAQEPVNIQSTGSFVCNRETFNKVKTKLISSIFNELFYRYDCLL